MKLATCRGGGKYECRGEWRSDGEPEAKPRKPTRCRDIRIPQHQGKCQLHGEVLHDFILSPHVIFFFYFSSDLNELKLHVVLLTKLPFSTFTTRYHLIHLCICTFKMLLLYLSRQLITHLII